MSVPAIPQSEGDVIDAVADALRDGARLAITGGGSKADIGAPVAARPLPMAGLRGVLDYDPAELVLTVRAGTPLVEVQELLAAAGQALAFEPFDHGPFYGRPAGQATIGGIVAAGVAGSQRISGMAARDHLLGFRAVSGRGEVFAAGAKVVKNVTGFDLPKLATGSWGRLFAMTEVTLKALPRPMEVAHRVLFDLDTGEAVRAMAVAMGSQADVAAAAHIPASTWGGHSVTILRVQGFGPSVAARCTMLEQLLTPFAAVQALLPDDAAALWGSLRTLEPLGTQTTIWRLNVIPGKAPAAIVRLDQGGVRWMADWAGGLIWLASDADAATIREIAEAAGGHATLIRGPIALRQQVPAFHPPQAGVSALEQRVRRAFDPVGLFETGRF